MPCVPRPAQRALLLDLQAAIRLRDGGVVDIRAVVVDEGSIRALPGGDTSAAAPELQFGGLDPQGAEAVEEVGLPADEGGADVGGTEFADVDLWLKMSVT